jgi:nitrogen fixation protein NifX
MRVAFATTDGQAVDAHFGSTPCLLVYEVDGAGARQAARTELAAAEEDGGHEKLEARLAAVAGCALVYAAAIGPTAAARLRALGVRAVAAPPGEPLPALLDRLVALLAGSPPPWLRRAMAGRPLGEGLEGAST